MSAFSGPPKCLPVPSFALDRQLMPSGDRFFGGRSRASSWSFKAACRSEVWAVRQPEKPSVGGWHPSSRFIQSTPEHVCMHHRPCDRTITILHIKGKRDAKIETLSGPGVRRASAQRSHDVYFDCTHRHRSKCGQELKRTHVHPRRQPQHGPDACGANGSAQTQYDSSAP
jgi:hypothetical protein